MCMFIQLSFAKRLVPGVVKVLSKNNIVQFLNLNAE